MNLFTRKQVTDIKNKHDCKGNQGRDKSGAWDGHAHTMSCRVTGTSGRLMMIEVVAATSGGMGLTLIRRTKTSHAERPKHQQQNKIKRKDGCLTRTYCGAQ